MMKILSSLYGVEVMHDGDDCMEFAWNTIYL